MIAPALLLSSCILDGQETETASEPEPDVIEEKIIARVLINGREDDDIHVLCEDGSYYYKYIRPRANRLYLAQPGDTLVLVNNKISDLKPRLK